MILTVISKEKKNVPKLASLNLNQLAVVGVDM